MFLFLNHINIIWPIFVINIKIGLIFSNEEICYTIKNCIKCPELDYCIQCKNGFSLNMPKINCKGKKDAELTILSKKLIAINSTIKASNIFPIKGKQSIFFDKTGIVANNTKNNFSINISISFPKKINKEKINIIFLIFIIIFILSIVFFLIFICIKIHMIKGYNEKVTLEDNMKII